MNGVREHDLRRKAAPARAAGHLSGEQHQHGGGERHGERQRHGDAACRGRSAPGAQPQHQAGSDGLGGDLHPRGRERYRQRERREGDRAPPALVQQPDERQHDERSPRRGLDVHVEVDRRQEESAERVHERAARGGLRPQAEPARQHPEEERAHRHVQGQQQGKERFVRPGDSDEVERVAERGERQRRSLVDIGVPEGDLAFAQPLEGEAAQREEMECDVAEVQAGGAEHAAQERQEGDECRERGDGGAASALAHRGLTRSAAPRAPERPPRASPSARLA